MPKNYLEINVQNEIAPRCDYDGDGKIDDTLHENSSIRICDNHGEYIGFRDAVYNANLLYDRAIDMVVYNWKNITPLSINQPTELSSIYH